MRQSLVAIPVIHILIYVAIGLDLPLFRQIIVFIYLTFVPGFTLLRFLKLKETKVVDTILFSIGLSIAFLMFSGLFINELFLIVGLSMPLSTIPLEIILSALTLVLFFVGNRRDLVWGSISFGSKIRNSKKAILESAILLLPVLFSITGALYVSFPYISTPILSLMIIMVAVLFVVSVFSQRLIPSRFYPLMIFAISIALALHILLISKYIIGYDAQLEYQIFKLTTNRGYWSLLPTSISTRLPNLISASNFNSMLSVTVLPSIYSVLLNIDGQVLFKTFYPFVFSLLPLVLYRVYEQQIGKISSLLSTLFLISSPLVFYGVEFLSLNRQIVAMFFLVLSVLVLLDKIMTVGKRRILFVVFGAALIVSHYSTGYLYLALIFFAYAMSRIKGRNNMVLNAPLILLLYAIGLVWYGFTESPLTTLTDFLYKVYSRFAQDVTSTIARDTTVFAPHSVLTFASAINWALFLAVHSMILVGILVVIFKSQRAKLDSTYRILLIMSSVVLFLSLAIPNVAPALDFSRFYQLSLLFLAPCFVLGGQALIDIFANLLRQATRGGFLMDTHKMGTVLVCAVLVGYFLSQSGFINRVTEAAPLSYSLDFSRIIMSRDPSSKASIYSAYIPEQNFFSAVWLSKYMAPESTVYADSDSRQTVLFSYGVISMQYLPLSKSTVPVWNSFVYLSSLNVRDGVITDRWSTPNLFNSSDISPILKQSDLIYSNGNGEIWHVTSSG
jgi:uncharacterized membrane protein